MTDTERAGWTAWALNTPRLDSLGQTHVLTGQNAFVGCNTLRLQAGDTIITTAPTIFNRGETIAPTLLQYDDDPPTVLKVNFAFSGLTTAPGGIMIYVGPPQNPSVNFFKGPYKFATKLAFTAGQLNLFANINISDLPYPINTTQKLSVKAVAVYDDGRYTAGYSILETPMQP